MAFPTGWGGYDTHSVTTEPGSSLTDFTFFVDLARMSASWWAAVKSDGGDIRASKEDNTQLPCDVIDFVDGSPGTGLLVVKFSGTKSSVTDEKVRVWAGNAAESLPASSDTYGQYNAYASHWKAFYPSGGGNDRTSNANNLTMTGSPTVGGVAGPIGNKGTDYNGSSQYGIATASPPTNVPLALIGMFYPDAMTSMDTILTMWVNWGLNKSSLDFRGDQASDRVYATSYVAAGSDAVTSASPAQSAWNQGAARFVSTTDRNAYVNGGNAVQQTTSRVMNTFTTITVAVTWPNGTNDTGWFDGRLSLLSVHNETTIVNATWIAYHHAMMNQATFWGTWGWTSTGAVSLPPISQIKSKALNRSLSY